MPRSLIWLMVGSLVWVASGSGAPAGEPKADLPDLEGKYVLLLTGNKQFYALEKVRLRNIGDRAFLVGNRLYLGSSKDGEGGYGVWVAVSNVLSFHVFASLEDLKKTKGARNAAQQFEGSVAPDWVVPNGPPRREAEAEKQLPPRGDWVAIAIVIGLGMFLGGLLVGWWWNRGWKAAPVKAGAEPS